MAGVPAAPELRQELLDLVAEDERVCSTLGSDGSLYQGYNAGMREVHENNAARLAEIIAGYGWPGFHLVGRDGSEAAWRIAQHAIALPPFQRRCLKLLRITMARGDADAQHAAYLEDRIAFNERRAQKYGTQFDWDEYGEMSPYAVDDYDAVDRRRRALGMTSFEEHIGAMRQQARKSNEKPPTSWRRRQQEIEAWAREVGWLPRK